MNKERIDKVQESMKKMGLNRLLITDTSSIQYLTDVVNHPGERFYCLMLSDNQEPIFFLNRLYVIPEDLDIKKVWFSDTDDAMAYVSEYIPDDSVVGIDKSMAAKWLLSLQEKKKAIYKNGSFSVDGVRMVKSDEEIETMKKASLINDQAIEQLIATIQPDDTERSLAERLLGIYQSLGASGHSFNPIVAFGKNGANPHHGNDDTRIQSGDSVIIDMGCLYHGYCSDMTRTYFYQSVSERQDMIYHLVLKANLSAQAMIRPGVRLCDIDKAARDVISEAGYGEYFTHRLGHFIGRDVHEYGDVSSAFDLEVKEGMIFSIEPGVYLPGEFGVRIEDLVVVTKDGCESLNHYTKDLQVVGK